jgi:hypothetical protein
MRSLQGTASCFNVNGPGALGPIQLGNVELEVSARHHGIYELFGLELRTVELGNEQIPKYGLALQKIAGNRSPYALTDIIRKLDEVQVVEVERHWSENLVFKIRSSK